MKTNNVLRLIPSLAALFSAIVLAGCSGSMETMLEDYNSKYTQGAAGTISYNGTGPGEDGFDESAMLAEKYDVRSDGTLNLYAPPRCASYNWSMEQIKEETTKSIYGGYTITTSYNKVSFSLSNGTTTSTQGFILYVPSSSLDVGTYRLTLKVTDEEGNEYTDKCILVIYYMATGA